MKETQTKTMYFIDKTAYLEHKELGLPYEPSSHDEQLTTFFTELEDNTKYQTQVTSMIRLKDYNKEGNQTEYLVWYETLRGVNHDGNSINVSDIPCGQTRALVGVERFKGEVVPKKYQSKIRYTVEFSKEEAEKLIDKSQYKESIQYIVQAGRNYGGFSKEEWLECSYLELISRAKLGVAGIYEPKVNVKEAPMQYQLRETDKK
jgi:hypothetical protein